MFRFLLHFKTSFFCYFVVTLNTDLLNQLRSVECSVEYMYEYAAKYLCNPGFIRERFILLGHFLKETSFDICKIYLHL